MLKLLKNNIQHHKWHFSQSKSHVQSLHSEGLARLTYFKRNRSVEAQHCLGQDFSCILDAWGIHSNEELNTAIQGLYLRCIIFFCLMLTIPFAMLLLPTTTLASLALLFMQAACIYAFICTYWRISVLKKQKYTPITVWIVHALRTTFQVKA